MLQTVDDIESKLTRNQRLVLTVLEEADQPLSAYRILDNLRQEGLKAPLQIYRALERLMDMGRVHRLESLNAFVICTHACAGHVHRHFTAFQICDACGQVEEFHDDQIERELLRHARKTGFVIRNSTIESRGICRKCQ
ncbi:Fur family transcriptional regulator [Rhizobium wenxiniae]|uniref:Fur family transcriptional regulator n=1 Tax=Rhizobium wenxiniae TaxID=1737357 RepID=UPI003C235AB0